MGAIYKERFRTGNKVKKLNRKVHGLTFAVEMVIILSTLPSWSS